MKTFNFQWVRSRELALTCLLAGLIAAAYWPVIHFGFIGYDDPSYVTENGRVKAGLNWSNVLWALRTGEASNWHPLTWMSHMLDVQLFGLRPGAHHLINLLLHLVNSLLLLLLLKRMTERFWPSLLVAALFALHPLHVESVAWIAERKDVLSTFFFMLTLLCYTRYAELRRTHQGARIPDPALRVTPRASFFYLVSLLCFALGLMSKPMLATVPCVLLLLDFWPLARLQIRNHPAPRGTKIKNLLLEKVPFFALAAASGIITWRVQDRAGSVSSLHDFPLSARAANAVASYLKYLGKTFWPADLIVYYPHPANNRFDRWLPWQIAAAAAFITLVSVLACLRWKRQPWFATGWFWFLGTLVPVIGLVQAGSQAMADRYTYIPLIGIFILIAWTCSGIVNAADLTPKFAWALALVAISACALVTRHQVNYWRDDFSLFEHALSVSERNAPAHTVLAAAFGRQNKPGLALVHAKAAVNSDPAYAGGWHTLGDIYDLMGRSSDAIPCYQTALQWNPHAVGTWFRLACVYRELGDSEKALQNFQQALRVNPEFAPAHNHLAALLYLHGRRAEASAEFAEAIRLAPDSAQNHFNFGAVLAEQAKLTDAERELTEAVRLQPDNAPALSSLGMVLARQGRAADSQRTFRQLTHLCPTNGEAWLNLGAACLLAGSTNEAAASFAEALRVEPNLPAKCIQAGDASVAEGRLDDAIHNFTSALWLAPHNSQAHERLGRILANRGSLEPALGHFVEVLRVSPGPSASYNVASMLARLRRFDQAVAHYEQALALKSDFAPALNDLAWILATAPQDDLRNGLEAVRLAQRAIQLTGTNNPNFLGTLDAAYAETGQFPEAIRTAEQVRDFAVATGDRSTAQAVGSRLALYREGKPFRQ